METLLTLWFVFIIFSFALGVALARWENWKVTSHKDNEITSEPWRTLVSGLICAIALGIFFPVFIVTLPVWLVLHFILRLFGRQGFVHSDGSSVDITVNGKGFRKKS